MICLSLPGLAAVACSFRHPIGADRRPETQTCSGFFRDSRQVSVKVVTRTQVVVPKYQSDPLLEDPQGARRSARVASGSSWEDTCGYSCL